MYKVKICGILEDRHIFAAAQSGASYVGFVFFEKSRRNVSIPTAQRLANDTPNGIVRVALLVNPSNICINRVLENVSIDMIQLHGNETVERVNEIKGVSKLPVMKAIGIKTKADLALINQYEVVADQILLDAKPPVNALSPGGLGQSFDWNILSNFEPKKPWLLAGGLNAQNVKSAINKTGASEFDVSSGVEDRLGVKSERKIFEFLNTLKEL